MTTRRGRPLMDIAPEFMRYRDDGCNLHPACLTCPLPRCQFDEPEAGQTVRMQVRNANVVSAMQEGLSAVELSRRFSIAKRTVHRILKQAREGLQKGMF